MLSTYVQGLAVGMSLIIAIGAQNAFVLKQGLKKQFVFWVCFVCALFLLYFRWIVGYEVDGPLWMVWAALGAYVGGPGPLLEPLWAVLGRSGDLCGRSWAALCASVGGLGRS